MKKQFHNKVILITGSSKGIGQATAELFLGQGASVIGISQSMHKKTGKYQHYKLDLSDVTNTRKVVKKIVAKQNIDILINNAGLYPQSKLEDVTEDKWDNIFAVNLKSFFYIAQEVSSNMKQNNGGVILNAASYAGTHPSIGSGIYAASKAAVISLTKSMAAEWAQYNIRVNAYSPGFILTHMTEPLFKEYGDKMVMNIALKRYGTPEEIAKVLLFLSSSDASYITGTNIDISGGKFIVQNQDNINS